MVREFVANRSTKDALETVQQELVPGNADMAVVIETWVHHHLRGEGY